ncbi:MAG TPA: response regulator [Gemmatimonadaceae bacterium]|nr:response regulator [Gemmatimonadaceae bacterium]
MSERVIRTVIVDDEPLARLRLRTLLAEHADFAVVAECGDGRQAVEVIGRERPDFVFLDIQMPEMDGLAVAGALTRERPPAVVFVTAYDQYALRAFEVHALDYLLKPFDEERFLATLERVRAHQASAETRDAHARLLALLRDLSRGDVPGLPERARAPGTVLRVAEIEVDVRGRTVRRAGAPVALRPKEFDLLVALLKRAGDVVSRRDLLHEVWGYSDDVVSRTIDTHVAELRRKLGCAPGQPGHIATVARMGYRLVV